MKKCCVGVVILFSLNRGIHRVGQRESTRKTARLGVLWRERKEKKGKQFGEV